MTCRQAGDVLSPYLDGELHSRPAARLEAHLAGSRTVGANWRNCGAP